MFFFLHIYIYIIFYLVHDDYMELIDLTINSARYDGFLEVYMVYIYIYGVYIYIYLGKL